MFKLEIECGNAAFADGLAPYEISRILKEVGDRLIQETLGVPDEQASGKLFDVNGNRVGGWTLDLPYEEVADAEEARTPPEEANRIATEEAARSKPDDKG